MGEITFRRPPLAEVSFSVRYAKPPELHSAHFGLFWSQVKKDFTTTSDQLPVFDLPVAGQLLTQPFGPPRVWLVHRDKALLIQLQQDRFYLNWRRVPADAEYPRFEKLLPTFQHYVDSWLKFLDLQELGAVEPTGYELSYINHLIEPGGWKNLAEAANYLKPLAASEPHREGSQLQGISWSALFSFADGRTLATLNTFENRTDRGQKMLQLEVKTETTSPVSLAKMSDWFKAANQEIVTTFVFLTTDWAQQEIWGRVGS